MPQPVKLRKDESIVTTSIVDDMFCDPEISNLAYSSILGWSSLDAGRRRLFVNMMGGLDSVAAAMYSAQNTKGAKTKCILAAAEKQLNKREIEVLHILEAQANSLQQTRDKLAHWEPFAIWPPRKEKEKKLYLKNLDKQKNNLFFFQKEELEKNITRISLLHSCYHYLGVISNRKPVPPKSMPKQEIYDLLSEALEKISTV